MTVDADINKYLETIFLARSVNTYRTYKNGLNAFKNCLEDRFAPAEQLNSGDLNEKHFSEFIAYLKDYTATTERLYITSLMGFYEYLVAENISSFNILTMKQLVRTRARIPRQRLPQFPKSEIDKLIDQLIEHKRKNFKKTNELLAFLRDKAFIVCLADTGLRVHEACNLRRGDVDWFEKKALVVGKGNREAIVRFSDRSINLLKEYLKSRSIIDGNSGVALSSLPLFSRHDKGAGKKVKPITTTTGRNIITARVIQFLGEDAVGTITPHSLRHYYVTRVLQFSGNLKLAQSLARHTNIAVTQRYAHISDDELDRGYSEIFDQNK